MKNKDIRQLEIILNSPDYCCSRMSNGTGIYYHIKADYYLAYKIKQNKAAPTHISFFMSTDMVKEFLHQSTNAVATARLMASILGKADVE